MRPSLDFGSSGSKGFPVDRTIKPWIMEMDLSILDGLSSNATVFGDFKGSSISGARSSAKKDVSKARW